ncbi:integrase arm-type DNA-binding domain-containing protein [Bradyrhizobium sp. SSUT112]|nr:integrase arm-type DNA-binding domain-containing protein [Bradyrhizobium sp. SSUT112]
MLPCNSRTIASIGTPSRIKTSCRPIPRRKPVRAIQSSPEDGWYLARDTELKGFFVVVGKRKRTFTVQGDLRQRGKRASSIRVSIGDASTTRAARAIAKEYLVQISKGQHPKARQDSRVNEAKTDGNGPVVVATLRQAWQRYLETHLIRKGRSDKTISGASPRSAVPLSQPRDRNAVLSNCSLFKCVAKICAYRRLCVTKSRL